MKQLLLLISFLVSQLLYAQSGTEPIKVTDMLKISQVGNVNLSPDGKQALFTVTSIEAESSKWEYKYVNRLYLIGLSGQEQPRQLGSEKESIGQPAWSPDGSTIAFTRSVDGRSQIFTMPASGGKATQVTRFRYSVSSPKWSPDGKQLLFSVNLRLAQLMQDKELNPGGQAPSWSLEKPGFPNNEFMKAGKAEPDPDGNTEQIRAYLQLNETANKAKVINKLNFQQEAATSSELSFTHFFITGTDSTSTPQAITKGFSRFGSIEFTPDGKQLVLTGYQNLPEHPDRIQESHIYLANTDGSNLQMILGEKGKSYNSPSFSPSGKWLAYQMSAAATVNIPSLFVVAFNGKIDAASTIEIPFDRNKTNLTWHNNEKSIFFSAQSNGGTPLFRADIDSKKVTILSSFHEGISSFDIRNNTVVYSKIKVTDPSELYMASLDMTNETQLTQLNTEWLKNKRLSLPQKYTLTNDKGQTVEYWVMKPANYQTGKKYPAILNIHGGPSAMWGPGEASMWHEFQYYAAQGYAVVYGNPRGSGGYGTDFLRGNINDWGAGPTSDVLSYLDKATQLGFIDTAKLAVTGGSYAGYLVAWIISHDQRFKAACAQRGVYDLRTFFGEGNAWRLVPNYFGGYPWENNVKPILERESPINYVDQIRTPFIIFHGENDLRTGVIQSEMLYKSLKVLGRPVEYVRHPGGTHELTRTGNNRQRIDQMLRTIEFFNRFIHP
jgi:dipeptidyl aminopeptidase/acylaminoacyl peptidase